MEHWGITLSPSTRLVNAAVPFVKSKSPKKLCGSDASSARRPIRSSPSANAIMDSDSCDFEWPTKYSHQTPRISRQYALVCIMQHI